MKSPTLAQQLRQLESNPEAYAEKAIAYLNQKRPKDAQLAALEGLAENPAPPAHDPLLHLYDYYNTNGPKRDPGAHMRRAILDALRPIATQGDIALHLEAVRTYEFLPPSFREDAVLLRSGALLSLNELDNELAAYFATKLLVDSHTEPMSGEPALTAVRVLYRQGQDLPLFQFAMREENSLPDVTSECLRCLISLPEVLIDDIITRHGESSQVAVRVGLIDLLVQHESGPQDLEFLAGRLAAEEDLDVYRYLAIALISSRVPQLLSLVSQTVSLEGNQDRLAVLSETADIFAGDPDVDSIAARLREKIR